MSRTSVALILGGVAVLAALVVLWRSIRSTEPEHAMVREPTAGTNQVAEPSHSASPTPQARAPSLAPAVSGERASEPPPPAMENAPPATRMNTKNLQYGGTQLRAQTAAVDPLVRQCVEQAVATGSRPTGNAVLTFVVAQKPDRVVVEDTGIDQDKTSIRDEHLLDCLRETARSMKFEGLPREAEALVVSRSVKLDNGALTEHKLIGFSYIR